MDRDVGSEFGKLFATTLRLLFRLIQSYLATPHSLRLSVGEIVELTHAVRRQLQRQADQLQAQVQTSTVAHVHPGLAFGRAIRPDR